jgi:DNA-directed RNA polymerase subunit omega
MLEDLKEEEIVNKVGGRFKLSTLIQKRMVALNTGAKPMVQMNTDDKLAVVIEEILQDKIYLDMSGSVQTQNNITTMSNITGTVFGNIGPSTMPVSTGRSADAEG